MHKVNWWQLYDLQKLQGDTEPIDQAPDANLAMYQPKTFNRKTSKLSHPYYTR